MLQRIGEVVGVRVEEILGEVDELEKAQILCLSRLPATHTTHDHLVK